MKSSALFTLILIFLSTGISFAQLQQSTSSIKAPGEAAAFRLNENSPSPTSLLLNRSPLGRLYGSPILAPQVGTQMLFSFDQSQTNFASSNEYGKFSSNSNYSFGSLAIAHALSSHFFAGLDMNYGQSKGSSQSTSSFSGTLSNSESKSNGAGDPVVNLGGRMNSERVSTVFSLGISLNTGDAESESKRIDSTKGEFSSNIKNGGAAFIPSVAIYSNPKDSDSILGLSLSYTIRQERTSSFKSSSGTVYKSTDSNGNIQNISVFAESPQRKLSFGGLLRYTKIEPSTYVDSGGNYQSSAFAYTTVTGFLKIALNKNMDLIPSLSLGRFGEGTADSDLKEIYSGGITGKATF